MSGYTARMSGCTAHFALSWYIFRMRLPRFAGSVTTFVSQTCEFPSIGVKQTQPRQADKRATPPAADVTVQQGHMGCGCRGTPRVGASQRRLGCRWWGFRNLLWRGWGNAVLARVSTG